MSPFFPYVNEFTQLYGGDKLIDNYILLATPVRNDYAIDFNNFTLNANIMNVYDNSDLIQNLGGIDSSNQGLSFGIAGQTLNEPVINIMLEVPNQVNLSNYLFPVPAYLYDEFIADHINLDSKEVWDEINP